MPGGPAALRGVEGGGVPGRGGGICCHLGQSREASHTPPPLVSRLAGSFWGRRATGSGLRDRGRTVLCPETGVRGWMVFPSGGKDEGGNVGG
jgi:hypothetical protein